MMTHGKFLLVFLFLAGCVTQPPATIERKIYVTVPLELPSKPELPKMSSDSLSCVSDETKWALLKRDVLIKNYINDLETIIKSTHQ